ncbi:MAG: hypothetical protein V1887_01970 [Candidatus Aenigmatarchaeota archaeon]
MARAKRKARHAGRTVQGKRKAAVREPTVQRVSFSTAGRDAQLRMLREKFKEELGEIMNTAAQKRKKAKSKQLQQIILWEMDQIRHADAKYRTAIDRLTKDVPAGDEEQRKNAPMFNESKTDKRPAPKEQKMAD